MKLNFIIAENYMPMIEKKNSNLSLIYPCVSFTVTLQTKYNFFSTKHVILHRHLRDSSKIIWFGYTEVI